jgi:hypothetical protein
MRIHGKVLRRRTMMGLPSASGSIDVSYSQLYSLTELDLPRAVGLDFSCSGNNLVDLEGCPPVIGRMLLADANPITSLHDIHRHVRSAKSIILPDTIVEAILGLLMIKDLLDVRVANSIRSAPASRGSGRLKAAVAIVVKHLATDEDILACQEELIDNDLDEFAEL